MKIVVGLLFTVLFISGLAQAQVATEIVFPQFVSGDGATSDLRLISLTNIPVGFTVELYGNDGARLSGYEIDGMGATLSPYGSAFLAASGSGAAKTGWVVVRLRSTLIGQNLNSNSVIGSLAVSMPGLGTASVHDSSIGKSFIAPVQRMNGVRTGIAITNVCTHPIQVELQLENPAGFGLSGLTFTMNANTHMARFFDEFLAAPDGTFMGTVWMLSRSDAGTDNCMATVAFDIGQQPGQFSALPIGRLP